MGSDATAAPEKKSLFRRWSDRNKSQPISDEDILKYTGKTREEFDAYKSSTPGVGGNQAAGTLAMGGTSGLVGIAAAGGTGGWGHSTGAKGPNRGLKYPPGYAEKEAAQAKAAALEQDSD
ncbi:hypothetical protein K4F52_004406 [Lecanicillium sp. MT-2017a]|nr:hypothetical protein K4F52_004406 [Lecanicillium sp. MT-2017a]